MSQLKLRYKKINTMNWNKLSTIEELDSIINESTTEPILIFKHSTRCSISATALSRLERNWTDETSQKIKPYYLDLIAFREVSNQIESKFNVEHQSPQILIIKDGKSIFDTSHMGISYQAILENL